MRFIDHCAFFAHSRPSSFSDAGRCQPSVPRLPYIKSDDVSDLENGAISITHPQRKKRHANPRRGGSFVVTTNDKRLI